MCKLCPLAPTPLLEFKTSLMSDSYIEHMGAKVGSDLKSVRHDRESLRDFINQ